MQKLVLFVSCLCVSFSANAVVFMDATWAQKACNTWNSTGKLTSGLGDKWIKNDGGRGYKLIQIYRDKCSSANKIQLTIQEQNGKAACVYGGKPDGKKMNYSHDYIMHATDKDWTCMGKGTFGCGPMGAMASGKLKFKGPKLEAMGVMGPFKSFLKLTGKVGGDKGTCN